MDAIRVETTIQTDGELRLTQLPCHKGDRVEAVIRVLDLAPERKKREEAIQDLIALARTFPFRSQGPYPSREELHERD